MNWWLAQVNNLFEMGLLMKSQDKMTDDRIKKLKYHTVKYGVRWRQNITYKKSVFWKMHVLECAFVKFTLKTQMSGRGSSEGFENKHYEMAALKRLLAPMVNTEERVNKLSQRQQISLLPGLEGKFEKLTRKPDHMVVEGLTAPLKPGPGMRKRLLSLRRSMMHWTATSQLVMTVLS